MHFVTATLNIARLVYYRIQCIKHAIVQVIIGPLNHHLTNIYHISPMQDKNDLPFMADMKQFLHR